MMATTWEKQAKGEERYLSYAYATKKKRAALQQMTTNSKFLEIKQKDFATPAKKAKPSGKPRGGYSGGFSGRGGRGGGRGGKAGTTRNQQRQVEKAKKPKKKGTSETKKPKKEETNPRQNITEQPAKVVWKVNKPDYEKISQAAVAQGEGLGGY